MYKKLVRFLNSSLTHNEDLTAIFDYIYTKKIWFSGSGTGSIPFLNKPFIHFINEFLKEHNEINTILDVGCGDFKIGSHFDLANRNYIGVDVSRIVIQKNREKYQKSNVHFLCSNACDNDMPNADLVVIKDVMIHLSHKRSLQLLDNIKKIPFIIIQNDNVNAANRDISYNGFFRPVNVMQPSFTVFQLTHEKSYVEGMQKPLWLLSCILPFIRYRTKSIFVCHHSNETGLSS